MKRLTLRILGCGSSAGVPRIGNDWGACDPNEPRNRRTRCSALVSLNGHKQNVTRLLIDTSPDLREQLLAANVPEVDAVAFSHDHADQVAGIDDLRVMAYRRRSRIPVFWWKEAAGSLFSRYHYCFESPPGSGYPAILDLQSDFTPFSTAIVRGAGGQIPVLGLAQDHGVPCLGFRIGPIAYCNDVVRLCQETLAALAGVEVFVVDALRDAPHPTHAHVGQALEWIAQLKPRRAVLTNLHIDLDYHTLRARLPDNVEPAFDGMEVSVAVGSDFEKLV